MHEPVLSGWLLVALCGASGAYCLLRMRAGGSAEDRGAAGAEALMGFGMAAMALPAAVLTPPEWGWAVYAVVFGIAALHGLGTAVRRGGGHHRHHLVGSLAMVYMAVAMAAAPGAHGGHAGHGAGPGDAAAAGGIPLLTGVLLVYFGGYALRSGARLVPVGAGAAVTGSGAGGGVVGDAGGELARVCRLSTALAMLAMLLAL